MYFSPLYGAWCVDCAVLYSWLRITETPYNKYLFPFNTGNVTEKSDRMKYTESVIAAFDTLYANAEDSAYINSEHAQIRSHANAR